MAARVLRCVVATLLLFAVPAAAQTWGVSVRDVRGAAGVEIVSVALGSGVERAGLRAGDLIARIDGNPVANAQDFARRIEVFAAGTSVAMSISRQGWERDLRVDFVGTDVGYGLTALDAANIRGAVIVRVEPGSAAAAADLLAGDVITHAFGRKVANARDLAQLVHSAAAGETRAATLGVARGSRGRDVVVAARPAAGSRGAAPASPAPAAPPPPGGIAEAPPSRVAAAAGQGSLVDDIVEANRLYEAGRWAEAETLYAKVVESVRDVPLVWGRLCHARVMRGEFVAALETCRQAAQSSPRDATIVQNIGYCLSRLGRHAEAIPEYRKVIELDPERIEPYRSLAGAYFAVGEWGKAEAMFAEVVRRDPKSQAAWQSLGDVAGELGKSTDAIAHYRKVLELGAGSAAVYRALGWHLYRTDRFAESEAALTEARRQNPRDANTLVTLGSVKFKLGKIGEAKDAWQRAADLEPNSPIGAIARQSLASLGGAAPGPRVPEPMLRQAPEGGEPEIDVGN